MTEETALFEDSEEVKRIRAKVLAELRGDIEPIVFKDGDIKYTIPVDVPFTESPTEWKGCCGAAPCPPIPMTGSVTESITIESPGKIWTVTDPSPNPGPDQVPSWTNYLLGLAFIASRRSKDPHTKHGCVLADKNGRVLGIGYNSPPAGMDDLSLPYNRPVSDPPDPEEESKYDWMLHSEFNALTNATLPLMYVPGGVVAYITGQPCHNCAMFMAQAGVNKFVIANRKGWGNAKQNTNKAARNFIKLTTQKGIWVEYVTPEFDWMLDGIEEQYDLGFFKKLGSFLSKLSLRKMKVYDIG